MSCELFSLSQMRLTKRVLHSSFQLMNKLTEEDESGSDDDDVDDDDVDDDDAA